MAWKTLSKVNGWSETPALVALVAHVGRHVGAIVAVAAQVEVPHPVEAIETVSSTVVAWWKQVEHAVLLLRRDHLSAGQSILHQESPSR